MSCECRKGATCAEHLAEAELSLTPAALLEELRLVTEDRDRWKARDEASQASVLVASQEVARLTEERDLAIRRGEELIEREVALRGERDASGVGNLRGRAKTRPFAPRSESGTSSMANRPASDAAIMLRDEALDILAAVLEDTVRGKVEISADHGFFEAHYLYRPEGDGDAGVSVISGERLPNLTDALVSLARKLDG